MKGNISSWRKYEMYLTLPRKRFMITMSYPGIRISIQVACLGFIKPFYNHLRSWSCNTLNMNLQHHKTSSTPHLKSNLPWLLNFIYRYLYIEAYTNQAREGPSISSSYHHKKLSYMKVSRKDTIKRVGLHKSLTVSHGDSVLATALSKH